MKKLLSFVAMAVIVVLTLSVPAYALVKSNDTVIIRSGEVINDDLFVGGKEVIIEGTVNGDVYVGAERLSVRGTVNGDVIAGAQTVEITGSIRDDLQVGANTVSLIGAKIGDSVVVAGNDLSIDRDSSIDGGLIFGGRVLSLEGSVGRGVTSASDSTRIDGEVGKAARIAATTITIDQDAIIRGDLEYSSINKATISGVVSGKIVRTESKTNTTAENFLRQLVVGYNTIAFFGAAIIGALLLLLTPQLFARSRRNMTKQPWKTIGVGAAVALATLPAIVIVSITVVGIPLSLAVLVLWALGIYFAKFFVAFSVGSMLLDMINKKKQESHSRMYLALLAGLILYYVLRLLPFIGMFVRFATAVVGLGMIVLLYHRPKQEPQL